MARAARISAERLVLFALGTLLLAVTNNINGGRDHWRTVLQADAKGYHAYLPALVVHHDLHFGFMGLADSLGSNPALHYEYRTAPTGDTINKYWCGTALMQAPFYLAAHGMLKAAGREAPGHGKPYVMAVCVAAIAYALLGLWAVGRLLAAWEVEERWRAWTLVALMLGTHLFYYTIVAPGMSHVYSFALLALLLLAGQRWAAGGGSRWILALGVLLGLLVLVRPVNGLAVLALPVVGGGWRSWSGRLRTLGTRLPALLAATALGAGIAGLQPLVYKVSTGHWWVDSYPGEHFQWTYPHPVDMLFSYRKGLFVYTPLCALALVGLPPLWRRCRPQAVAWLCFMLLLTYVLSSWWNWWYGGGFSARPFVEYLPLFALPLGLALQTVRRPWRRVLVTAMVLLIALCQVQTYQARYFRIHYEEMDRERYWDEFLRIDRLAEVGAGAAIGPRCPGPPYSG